MGPDVLVDLSPLDTWSRYSGTGRYVHELGVALAALSDAERRGMTFGGLASVDSGDMVPLEWPGSGERPPWDVSREVAWLMARRLRLPFTLRRIRPKLFHATYAAGTPRFSGVPRVVTCLDLVPLVMHRDYLPGRFTYRRVLWLAEALRYHSATRVLAISQHSADEAMQVLGVPARKIDVADLGVDHVRYHPFEGKDVAEVLAVRTRYGLSNPYIFYIGAADPRKNVDVLIAAFARAAVEGLELVLIGKPRPADQRAFDGAIAAAGHPRGIRFLGFVPEDDLPALIAGGVGFVCCSTHEGFGNVHLEAMACGCPVITPAVTSMRDSIGAASLVVPPRYVAATADAIRRLARERALQRQLCEAGIRCAAGYTWRNTALGTVESYARALA